MGSNNNDETSYLKEKVESLEESNSQMIRHIEYLNETLETEQADLDDLRMKLVTTERKLKRAEFQLRAPLTGSSRGPTSREMMLQGRVEELEWGSN